MTTSYQDNAIWDRAEKIYGYDLVEQLRDIDSDCQWLVDVIGREFNPEDVFTEEDLEIWAEDSDYVARLNQDLDEMQEAINSLNEYVDELESSNGE